MTNNPSQITSHRILGIDPGTLYMGYALLDTEGKKASVVAYDVLDVHKTEGQYARLQKEFFFLQELIDRYQPTELAIETQFVDKNPQTMIKIVHAQGVAIAAALSRDLPIHEYSPMKVKMAITGNGHSTKQQVADMLFRIFPPTPSQGNVSGSRNPSPVTRNPSKHLDATDALGIAYCHFLQLGLPIGRDGGAKDWTTYAQRKGLVEKNPSLKGGAGGKLSPNARLLAAMATAKKKK